MSLPHSNIESSEFFWGVGTSGYQHEGGYNQAGQPLNNWFEWEQSQWVEPSGRSSDFWNRYESDFELAKTIGLNAFRLGIEWSRVQPTTDPEQRQPPSFDETTLQHYAEIVWKARGKGLEPFITWLHFAHPHWLGADPWLDTQTVDLFLRFIEKTLVYINTFLLEKKQPAIRWMFTINELNLLVFNSYHLKGFPAKGRQKTGGILKVYENLLIAHVKAYRLIYQLYVAHPDWGVPRISFNNYATDLYWADAFVLDLISMVVKGVTKEGVASWLGERHLEYNERFRRTELSLRKTPAYWLGQLIKRIHHRIVFPDVKSYSFPKLFSILSEKAEELPLDYLAVDYYSPFVAHAFRMPEWMDFKRRQVHLRQWFVESVTSRWWHWYVIPHGLRFFCDYFQQSFPGMPIIIAENGMAQRRSMSSDQPWRKDQMKRSDFLRHHIEEVMRLRQKGVPLQGYFYWSLTDNYEWGSFAPRFGLFHIDFHSLELKREAMDPFGDSPSETYRKLIVLFKEKL